MGFEIIFSYREASDTEKGVYDDEVKVKKVKIGSPDDGVGLEAVAGRIFAQFARRNILVTDVEIWEYTKKKLSFKETEDGFLIKNRKFRFDDGPVGVASEEIFDEQQVLDVLRSNPQIAAQLLGHNGKSSVSPSVTPPLTTLPIPQISPVDVGDVALTQGTQPHQRNRVLRYEVYDPDPVLLNLARSSGLSFTPKKQYPIYGEKMGRTPHDGMIYVTVDDSGQQKNISDRYFIGPQAQLEGAGQFIEDSVSVVGGGGPEPRLMFEAEFDDNMPNIRR